MQVLGVPRRYSQDFNPPRQERHKTHEARHPQLCVLLAAPRTLAFRVQKVVQAYSRSNEGNPVFVL